MLVGVGVGACGWAEFSPSVPAGKLKRGAAVYPQSRSFAKKTKESKKKTKSKQRVGR